MAATNFTPIQLYHSLTASAVPTAPNLAQGELAINIYDGKLYYEDVFGVVQVIASKNAGTVGGSTTQIQYNNAGALAGNAAMVFNNSTNVTTLTTLNLTNALGAIYGGTAQSTYTQGDFLYASASNTLAKLGIGANTYILTSTGSVPQWVAPSSIAVLTATNLAGGLAGSVPYQSALDTTTFLAIGAANRVMTSTGSAPQWVTSLTGLTGVSSSSITNTSLTSGRVVVSTTAGLQADDADLTFDGTTLSAGGFSTVGLSTLVKTVKIGDSSFNGVAVFAAATPAKLYMGTGTVTDVTSAISATNAIGAIASLGITPIAATNTSVTYTNASTLYIAGAPSAGTNITITNPYSLYIAAGASYFGGLVTATGFAGPLNGTVGATTPTTGAFTTLTTSSTVTINGGTANTKLNVNTTTYTAVTNGEQVLIEGSSAWQQGLAFSMWSAGLYNSNYASGYIGVPNSSNQIYISGGAAVVNNTGSGGWAKALNTTSASFMVVGDGSTTFYGNTGLTANTTFTPSVLMSLTTTGLAVTGTLSATGTLSGGTSGTAYSFSGSAPATSLTLTSGGDLGIGTSSPAYKLDVSSSAVSGVVANFQATASNTYGTIRLTGNNRGGEVDFYNGATAQAAIVGGSSNLYFYTNGNSTLQATLDSAGNLGLGVAPSAWYTPLNLKAFQVGTTASLINYVSTPVNFTRLQDNTFVNSGGANTYITAQPASFYQQTAGSHQWFTSTSTPVIGNDPIFSQAMTLDANGSLIVGGTSAIAGSVLTLQETASLSAALALKNRNSTQTWKIAVDATAVDDKILSFIENAGSSVRMALTDTGNLLVGVTATTSTIINGNSDGGFAVQGKQTNGGASVVGFFNAEASSGDGSPVLGLSKAMTTTSSSARFVQFFAGGVATTPMGGIVGNGASNVQFATLSDAREKTNIQLINGSLAKISALKPVEFDWIKSGEHVKAGFVAQDVEEIFPEFVVDNMSSEGEEVRKGLTGGMTGGIIPHLVKAIQEQQAIIELLKARLDAANL